ncbi:LysM domain-containing protein [Colletotrichum sojae]|uniref:LysM domain-containing protein n=1 Tax=Colletotrichum sojae TaxID=2175907 RepID=A0A8H6MN92_9PEZI|nr:LysM domain-containing protein [Colletotrichum sojae]
MDSSPQYPYDPNTSPYCGWWFDNHDSTVSCENMPLIWELTREEWTRWNPSLKDSCDAWQPTTSWCVDAFAEPPVPDVPGTTLTTITTAPPAPSTTSTPPSTTVTRNNGIQTPEPIQEGMTLYCNRFYYVPEGATCAQVLAENNISMKDLFEWNPAVGSNCNSLWAHTYICVGRIPTFATVSLQLPPKPTTAAPTPTKPANGIETPSPIQDGMVTNCEKFHFVSPGDRCAQILAYNNISVEDLYRWNPAVGPNCQGMWASTYVCVGV